MFRQDQFKKTRTAKRHFDGTVNYKPIDYPLRLNLYTTPPTAEITLDEFEQWAIDRLKVLGEIETSIYRNKTPEELKTALATLLKKHLHLDANSTNSPQLYHQRQKDHYSHFILRLAFARSEELRRRFSKAESFLFRYRFETTDGNERAEFIDSLGLDWEAVSAEERNALGKQLAAAAGSTKPLDERYFKVDWERVVDLVEHRRVLIRGGKAFVPASLQVSMVVAEFTARLDRALELTARALPRLDEDDRLLPILKHLSLGFAEPDAGGSELSLISGEPITAGAIDGLSQYFPACMLHMHKTLRQTKHLKHYGRLQYTLFLKGIGLSVEEALTFWRTAFANTPSDKFDKEYRYNVRHAYGLEGGRKNYRAKSCQQILTETQPGVGDAHGCPYRTFSWENLSAFLGQQMGVRDPAVLRTVQEDIRNMKYHIACNRVFEHLHAAEMKREHDRLGNAATPFWTIIHPNEYFVRSWELKNPDAVASAAVGGGAGTRRAGEAMEVDMTREGGGEMM